MSVSDCFDLAKELAAALNPLKLSYKNNLLQSVKDEPDGIYFEIKTKVVNKFVWKLDIWVLDMQQFNEKFRVCEHILSLLTPENRIIILKIKNQLCHHPNYRDSLTNLEIYNAVLNEHVKDV